MRGAATGQLISEIGAPLERALELIDRRAAEIHAAWKKKLHMAGLREDQVAALAQLLETGSAEWLRSGFDAYRHQLESYAEALEARGLSEAQLTLAIGLFLESCLPYLPRTAGKSKQPAEALTRFAAITQAVLFSAHAHSRAGALRRLQEQERHSLSRDLHDDIGHNLLVLKLYLEMMTMDLNKGDVAHLGSKLQEALALVSYAVESVRRLMLDLGPAMLSQFGFQRAVSIYARQFTLRTGIEVNVVESGLPENLASGQETALYRVLQGALSNVLQHAHAGNVKLRIGAAKGLIIMSIEDDGMGFDVTNTLRQRAFGIRAMRERVELLGGRFHISSVRSQPGSRRHGTRIEIDMPLEEGFGK